MEQIRDESHSVLGQALCKYLLLTDEMMMSMDNSTDVRTCQDSVLSLYDTLKINTDYKASWIAHLWMTLVSLVPQLYVVFALTRYIWYRVDGVMDTSKDREILPKLLSLLVITEVIYFIITTIPLLVYYGWSEGILTANWDIFLGSFIHAIVYNWWRGSFKLYYDQLYQIDLAAIEDGSLTQNTSTSNIQMTQEIP